MQNGTSGLLTKAHNFLEFHFPDLSFQLRNNFFFFLVDKCTANPHLNHTIFWFNLNYSIYPFLYGFNHGPLSFHHELNMIYGHDAIDRRVAYTHVIGWSVKSHISLFQCGTKLSVLLPAFPPPSSKLNWTNPKIVFLILKKN